MILVQTIDSVVAWLRENVCPQIVLKLPDDYKNDEDYGAEYVNPAAFPLFVPGKDRLPPDVPAPIPSICVQLMEGSDDMIKRRRQLQLRLCLACWNPGKHGSDVLYPRENPAASTGTSYYRLTGEEAETYERNMDGWRDSLYFLGLVLHELEGAEYIAGHRLVKEAGIKYGPFTEDGNIWDYYPYWHNFITLTLEAGVVARTPDTYSNLL